MQVKISYTAEVTDVPQEVSNILNTITSEGADFFDIVQECKDHLDNSDLPIAKLKMKFLTDKLQKMFARLADCQAILEGYEKVTSPQTQTVQQQNNQEQNAKTESQNR